MQEKKVCLLYDESMVEEVKERIIPLLSQYLKSAKPFKTGLKLQAEPDDIFVTFLSDELLKEFLIIASKNELKVGFLPHVGMQYTCNVFGVSSSVEEAIKNILNDNEIRKVDLLLANGRPVFNTVVIGEPLSFMYGSAEPTIMKRRWGKVKNFFNLFRRVKLNPYTIEYKERENQEKEVANTAALGMIIVQHGKNSLLSRRIIDDAYINDGMLHNLILAPESIVGLVRFGLTGFFKSGKNPKLPPFAAHIKTNKMKVLSSEPMDIAVDDTLMSAKEVELEVMPKALQIVAGSQIEVVEQNGAKEIFKTQPLPTGEKRDELLRGPLPLIYHATKEEFAELFKVLRDNARPKPTYLVLMFLSTFIAALGLFSNSSPVIIGAMILAPLMDPIISLSMGLLRQDVSLIRNSLKTIGFGLLLGYICAALITCFLPLTAISEEMMARLKPNLLDLGVAVGSGMAGAYAHAKKEVAKTLAGVAIAVALVPPLAVSGIGIGWLDWRVFSGAFLLLMTNLAGIVLAAAITFLLLGFSPFRLAKKGLFISLIFVIGVGALLVSGFSNMVKENNIVQRLNGYEIDSHIILKDIDVRRADPLKISVRVITERPLTVDDLKKIKQEVEGLLEEDVELEILVGIKI